MKFKFVPKDTMWQLIDEDHPGLVIATLKNDLEIVALRSFCEHYANDSRHLPEHFPIEHKGRRYVVTPLGSLGETLTLLIQGQDQASCSIQTTLVLS